MRNERVRVLVEISLTIALAAVLNTLKVFEMPQGGTVSLVMLPLFVLSVRRGLVVGLVAGALYGFLDALIDPFVVHWAQFLLDYPVGYAAVGLGGLFSVRWRGFDGDRLLNGLMTAALPAVAVGAAARYAAHVASGVIFFSEYAEGQPVLAYSAAYNLYVPVSAAACFVALSVVLPALERAVPSGRPTDSAGTVVTREHGIGRGASK